MRSHIARHPGGAQAERLGRFQRADRILDQNAITRADAFGRQQLAQHQLGRLGPQLPVHRHRFDRHLPGEMAVQRSGQQDLAARQALEKPPQAAFGADHRGQIAKLMRFVQKFFRPHLMMLYHAQQRRAVAPPVAEPRGVHRLGIGRRAVHAQHHGNVGIHIDIDGRKNRVRRVMQGIVEIEQPDQLGHGMKHNRMNKKPRAAGRSLRMFGKALCRQAVALAVCLCGFALASMPAIAASPAETAAVAHRESTAHHGTLYRIQHKDKTSYLFGTIHVGQAGAFPLDEETAQVFARTQTLVIEVDVRNQAETMAAFARHALYAGTDTIAQHLSPASLSRLKATAQKFGIPFEQLARMKPWMAANMLINATLEQAGFAGSQGTEVRLLERAAAQSKSVQALETADYQLSLFEEMTAAQQEAYLNDTLDVIESGKARNKIADMMNAWNTADAGALDALLKEMMNEDTASSAFMRHALLDRRNPQMAARIATLLDSGRSAFVAIGALHLVGENGVPALLRRRGFAVQKLY